MHQEALALDDFGRMCVNVQGEPEQNFGLRALLKEPDDRKEMRVSTTANLNHSVCNPRTFARTTTMKGNNDDDDDLYLLLKQKSSCNFLVVGDAAQSLPTLNDVTDGTVSDFLHGECETMMMKMTVMLMRFRRV
jgi:hypothetical protein